MTLRIISREQWGAAAPRRPLVAIDTPTPELWLHHTAGTERGAAGVRAVQAFHQRPVAQGGRGWNDIAYSFLVDPIDLEVYEGRGAGFAGGHTKGHNTVSHAICVLGNFDTLRPTPQLLQLLADLIGHGADRGWWRRHLSGGHRDASGASTSCPGRFLESAIPDIRRRLASDPTPTPGGGFMPDLTDAEQRELLTAARMVNKGAPGYGIPPLGQGLLWTLSQVAGFPVEGQPQPTLRKLVSDIKPTAGASLTPADVEAIANRVADLLASRLSK